MERFGSQGRPRGGPPVAKPYVLVPLTPGALRRGRPTGHQQYRENLWTGMLEGIITARSPVHVASGQIELTDKRPSLVKAHFRRNGRLTLPGSSLKGAIRSIVEAISHPPSCLRATRARGHEQPQQLRACNRQESLCIACQMFGAMGYLGQVYFHDAVIEAGESTIITTPPLFRPRERERTYFADGRIKGRKFYRHGELAGGNVPLEVCPVGSRFRLYIAFENLSETQLGLLLIALGQGATQFHPKLGGAKPACCGSVEIQPTGLQAMAASAAALEYDVVMQALDVAALAQTATLVNQEALNQLAQVLRYPGTTACPGGSY
jgi:CRISPR-associated protein Csm3